MSHFAFGFGIESFFDIEVKNKDKSNISMLIVSHDGSDLLALCDKITHLKNGKLGKHKTPNEFYYKSRSKEEAKLFGP